MTAPLSPVLIVGSGPSGLIAALTLLKNGIPVRIIEKVDKFHNAQRGAGIMPRSLEVYHFLGVDEISNLGQHLKPRCSYELPGGRKPKLIFEMSPRMEPTPDVPFINTLLLGQHHAEEIFRAHIEKFGVHVELGSTLVDFEQDSVGVTAHIVKKSGDFESREVIRTPFLIGTDGSRGITRNKLGLTFVGESRPADHLIVADLYVDGLDTKYWHTWGDFTTAIVTLRPTEYEDRFSLILGGRDIDYKPLLESREKLIKFVVDATDRDDLVFGDIIGVSEFSPNIRMVDRFSKGRVFVVGDAAHVHSPTGGQGMNSSIQDSFNLGWKMALVCKGLASLSLLETYNEERTPVIKQMLEQTTKILDRTMKAKVDKESFNAAFNRPKALHQLGVNCRWSSIVIDERHPFDHHGDKGALEAYGNEAEQSIRAGDRAPDAPGLTDGDYKTSLFDILKPHQHTVLIFDSACANLQQILDALDTWPEGTVQRVVIIGKDSHCKQSNPSVSAIVLEDAQGHVFNAYGGIAADGYPIVVIRPDGVIGAIVKGVEGLMKYRHGVLLQ